MSLPELRGAGRLLTDPRTGETKTGGRWCSVLVKFSSWRKVDDEWTEGDGTIGSVIAFDDAAATLAGFSKNDDVAVQGNVSAAVWKDAGQLKITAAKVWTPERRSKGYSNASTPTPTVVMNTTAASNRSDNPTVDRHREQRPRGDQPHAGSTPTDLDARRREAGQRLVRQHQNNAQRAGRLA